MEATLIKGSKYIEKVLILSNFSLNCEKIVWRSCATHISLQNESPRESSHEINCASTRDTVMLSSWVLLKCLSLHQYGRWMSSHSFFSNKDNVPSTCCQLYYQEEISLTASGVERCDATCAGSQITNEATNDF